MKKEEQQLYPQWSIAEALLNGALPTGYKIRKVDVGRRLIGGMLNVDSEHVGLRVWASADHEGNKIMLRPENSGYGSTIFVLPR